MRVNEFRIGNYYDHDGRFKKATPIVIEALWESERNWCKQIPLTEEWLIKFGFVKYGTLHDSYKLNPFIVELGILGNHYTFRKIMNKDESVLLKEMKYVHQLQNLYFALTNKELTINK